MCSFANSILKPIRQINWLYYVRTRLAAHHCITNTYIIFVIFLSQSTENQRKNLTCMVFITRVITTYLTLLAQEFGNSISLKADYYIMPLPWCTRLGKSLNAESYVVCVMRTLNARPLYPKYSVDIRLSGLTQIVE